MLWSYEGMACRIAGVRVNKTKAVDVDLGPQQADPVLAWQPNK